MRLTQCDICQKTRARNFCPQLRCLKYMCEPCWQRAHMDLDNLSGHLPMVRSPPIRTRFSTNNASIPCNNHKIHDGISGRAQNKVMEVSEKAEANARNLYRFLNSLPITPMPSLECDSEPSRDWNTDCGLFDGRGPPPHYGSRLVTNTVQPSARRCNFKKTGSESYSRHKLQSFPINVGVEDPRTRLSSIQLRWQQVVTRGQIAFQHSPIRHTQDL
ncbi:hypothetical protein OSTOST_25240 [Ostertagia ostertagi]